MMQSHRYDACMMLQAANGMIPTALSGAKNIHSWRCICCAVASGPYSSTQTRLNSCQVPSLVYSLHLTPWNEMLRFTALKHHHGWRPMKCSASSRFLQTQASADRFRVLFMGRDEFSCLVLQELFKAKGALCTQLVYASYEIDIHDAAS